MSDHEKYGWEKRHDELHQPGVPMPGPWNWEVHDHSMASLCGGGEDAIVGLIMSISPCGACQDRADPKEWVWGRCCTPLIENARLIAATPDLLAALRHCETVMMIVEPRSHRAEYLEALRGAKAAIAKAEGRT
jgi:hypothetical protein